MAAFSLAVECGVDGIELDIHLTSDGVPVVIHDDTLERTTDGTGLVADVSSSHVALLDAGAWFDPGFAGESVPALDDVLKVFAGQVVLNLEIKDFSAGMEVLDALKKYSNVGVVVSSFDARVLQQLRAEDSGLPLAVLFAEGNWRHFVRLAEDLSARSFHPAVDMVKRPLLAACDAAGLPVHVWTVDDPSVARSLLRAGVSGVFTNDPVVLGKSFFSAG